MVIYELGIMHEGTLMVSKQYYKEYNLSITPSLRGGFLSALFDFAAEAFSDEIDTFTMKNFKIFFLTRPLGAPGEAAGSSNLPPKKIIAYCIGGKKLNLKTAKKAVVKVLDEFFQKYGPLRSWDGNINTFTDFLPVFDKILGDLAKKPFDRLRTLFK